VQKCRICPNASSNSTLVQHFSNSLRRGYFVQIAIKNIQNELRKLILPPSLFSFVQRQYPRDTRKQVEALHSKLCALDSMFKRLRPVQEKKEIVGVTATVLLSKIYG
jgi:hypothetical protein